MYWVDIIFGKEIWSPVPDCLHHHFALILLYLSILILSWGRVLLGVTRRYLFVWQKCWRPSKVFQAWISRLVNILLQSQWHWCTIFSRSHEWFIFNKTWKTISLVPAPERLPSSKLCRACACLDGKFSEIGRRVQSPRRRPKSKSCTCFLSQGVGEARSAEDSGQPSREADQDFCTCWSSCLARDFFFQPLRVSLGAGGVASVFQARGACRSALLLNKMSPILHDNFNGKCNWILRASIFINVLRICAGPAGPHQRPRLRRVGSRHQPRHLWLLQADSSWSIFAANRPP